MAQKERKWGDRKDGIWLKDLPPLNRIMPGIMPNRADNEAYINVDIDLRPLERYLEKKNEGRTEDKYTFFHLISAAIGKETEALGIHHVARTHLYAFAIVLADPIDGALLPFGIPLGRVDTDHVNACFDKRGYALGIVTGIDTRAYDITLLIVKKFHRVFLVLIVILAEYEIAKISLL